MTSHVYHLHSTVELLLEDVVAYCEDAAPPAELDGIELTRRNNTLIIQSIAPEGTVGKYTPTAQLKATVSETRVPDEDADPVPRDPTLTPGSPAAEALSEAELELPTKVIEVAGFKGDRESILQNTAFQYPMFEVLCDLAREARRGTLNAIVGDDQELRAVRIVDGEDRPANVEIVEDRTQDDGGAAGVDWMDNEYIS